jgi:hypothetical protein
MPRVAIIQPIYWHGNLPPSLGKPSRNREVIHCCAPDVWQMLFQRLVL